MHTKHGSSDIVGSIISVCAGVHTYHPGGPARNLQSRTRDGLSGQLSTEIYRSLRQEHNCMV